MSYFTTNHVISFDVDVSGPISYYFIVLFGIFVSKSTLQFSFYFQANVFSMENDHIVIYVRM